MARPKNPMNRYSLTCKVTGESIKTNPKQFNDLMRKFDLTAEELDASYVGRKGRHIIEDAKMTPEQAMSVYGLHFNVAFRLKATVKTVEDSDSATATVESVETPVSVDVSETVESVVPVTTETVENAEAILA